MVNKSLFDNGISPSVPFPIDSKGWIEVFLLGRYGWQKGKDILSIVNRSEWELELNGKLIFSNKDEEKVLIKLNQFIKEH